MFIYAFNIVLPQIGSLDYWTIDRLVMLLMFSLAIGVLLVALWASSQTRWSWLKKCRFYRRHGFWPVAGTIKDGTVPFLSQQLPVDNKMESLAYNIESAAWSLERVTNRYQKVYPPWSNDQPYVVAIEANPVKDRQEYKKAKACLDQRLDLFDRASISAFEFGLQSSPKATWSDYVADKHLQSASGRANAAGSQTRKLTQIRLQSRYGGDPAKSESTLAFGDTN